MAKDVSSEIEKTERKLQKLKAQQCGAVRQKLIAARKMVSDLEAQLATITGKRARPTGRRKRTSRAEMKKRIFGSLSPTKGSSIADIRGRAKLPYVSVYNFVHNHPDQIRATGKGRDRLYFLKAK